MNTKQSIKGIPKSVFAQGNLVEIWVSSPTGDSSDSFIYSIPCLSPEQAEFIAKTWRSVWELPEYGASTKYTDNELYS